MKRVIIFLMVVAICGLSIFSLGESNAQVNITYWHPWGGSWGKMQEKTADIFNRTHPEIKVTALTIPFEEMRAKLLTTIAGGNPPQVVTIWGGTDAGLYPDMFTPLDSFVRENEELMGPQNWFPGVLDYVRFEDKLYGLLWVSASEGVWYNIDMFKEAGLDPQNPPTYWSDLEIAAEKLTKKDSRGRYERLGFCGNGTIFPVNVDLAGMTIWLPYWSYRNNARWWDPETRKMTLADPKNIETWRWIRSWYEKYGVEEVQRFLESVRGMVEENTGGLAEGKYAMHESGPWMIGYVADHNPDLNYDVTMVPYPRDGRPVTNNYCDCMYIPRGTEHLQEAWTFLSWMVTEGVTRWCSHYGEMPARYDVAKAASFEKLPRYDLFKKTLDYLEYGKSSLPGFPLRSVLGEQTLRYFEQVIYLKMSPEKALEELQAVMQKELDKFYEK